MEEWKLNRSTDESRKVAGALKNSWKMRKEAKEGKMDMYNGIVVPSVLHGCEINAGSREKVDGWSRN